MNNRILFVDDEPNVLDALRRMLHAHRGEWDIEFVADPMAAWDTLQDGTYDVLVSDVSMPGISGLDLLERVKASQRLRRLSVIILTGLGDRDLKRRALDLGADDLLSKPVDPEDLLARLRSALRLKTYEDELALHNQRLEEQVRERTAALYRSRMEVVWRLAKAAEYRDDETGNHVIRVGCMSRIVAETLGMDRQFVETIFAAAPLHDIGKIGIPDAILLKPGALSRDEWHVMRRHCRIGAKILAEETAVEGAFEKWLGRCDGDGKRFDNPILQMATNVALMHHEKWDGTGYPQQLSGEHILMEARIVAVADIFDALTSRRPYKEPYPESEALEILRDMARSHFDPQVYEAFRKSFPAIRSVREQLSDSSDLPLTFREAHIEADPICR